MPSFDRSIAVAAGNHLARWLTALPPNVLDTLGYRRGAAEARATRGLVVPFLRYGRTRETERRGVPGRCARQRASRCRHRASDLPAQDARPRKAGEPCPGRQGHLLRHRRHQPEAPPQHVPDARRHAGQRGRASARCWRCRGSARRTAIDCWLAHHRERDRPRRLPAAGSRRALRTASRSRSCTATPKDAWCWPTRWRSPRARSRRFMLDFATLTGRLRQRDYRPLRGRFHESRRRCTTGCRRVGRSSGERVWCFPMDEDFDSNSKATLPTCCSARSTARAITSSRRASCRSSSMTSVPWVHVDLARRRAQGRPRARADRIHRLRRTLRRAPARRCRRARTSACRPWLDHMPNRHR